MTTPDLGGGSFNKSRKLSATMCFVIGGLWIFLTGACSEAVFGGIAFADKLTLEMIFTLPGCIVVLAGMTMRLNAALGGLILLAYAALLSFMFTAAVLRSGVPNPNITTTIEWLAFANVPSVCLVVWAGILLLEAKRRET